MTVTDEEQKLLNVFDSPHYKIVWMSDFSFLCTFVPGSEKSTDGIFVPWSVEHSLLGTFAHVELSFLGSERPKNFRSLELSFLWNFRSFRTNIPRTFAPCKRL